MKLPSLALVCSLLLYGQTPRKSHLDEMVAAARLKVEKSPASAENYVELANALARSAREKSDPSFDLKALEAVAAALRLQSADFEARKVRVIVRLHQERFADALEEAQVLNKEIPDDNLMYGLIADAHVGLGNYKEAEASSQRMLDMRQVSAPGLERGARLREIFGYTDGAIDWWGSALRLTSASDDEQRAYILVQVARVHRFAGKQDLAARHAQQALELVPDYPAALTELGQERLAQGKPLEAAELFRRRLKLAPDVETAYWLATAVPSDAPAWADFKAKALAQARDTGQASPVLILYEAEHGQAANAVKLGAQTAARRHDCDTLDAYAWALYMAGDYPGASAQMKLALAPGVRRAMFFYHAGMIAWKNNDLNGARTYFKQSLEVDAGSTESLKLMKIIAELNAI